jgi:hypothetical protein
MGELATVALVLGVYIAAMRFVLPKLGVPT